MKRFTRAVCMLLAVLSLTTTMSFGVSAAGRTLTTHIAKITASSLWLRAKPSSKGTVITSGKKGEYAAVIGKSGSWYKVIYNQQTGYMHADHLTVYTKRNIELGYGRVNGTRVNVRSKPNTDATVLTQANAGDKAYIIGLNNKWFRVIIGSKVGYIRSDYVDLTQIPLENKASKSKPLFYVNNKSTGVTPSASALKGTTTSSTAQKIVTEAKKHLGVPYVWAGTTPSGFDCSGFVQYVMKKNGISLPRTTTEQYKVGTYVSKANLKPGDLVFLQNTYRTGISHVGIYIGDGKMIHASSSKGVTTSALSGSYYTEHYYGARRVL